MKLRQPIKKLFSLTLQLVNLPEWLNWVLRVVEPCVVLAIACMLGYAGYWLLLGPQFSAEQTRLVFLMRELNENWKVAVLLLILLFYRTLRIFLEQAEEAWGVKRKKPLSEDVAEVATNPQPKP